MVSDIAFVVQHCDHSSAKQTRRSLFLYLCFLWDALRTAPRGFGDESLVIMFSGVGIHTLCSETQTIMPSTVSGNSSTTL